jgi:uncharacterized protein with HEPN domain
MQNPDFIRIRHMLDACREALGFAGGKSRSDLDKDRMLVLALVKEVEIIGEAASKVSPEIKSMYPEIPWSDMAFMRNRLIHAYFDVDLDVVWETIQKDLPDLMRKLQDINPSGLQEPPAVYRAGKPKAKASRAKVKDLKSLRKKRK